MGLAAEPGADDLASGGGRRDGHYIAPLQTPAWGEVAKMVTMLDLMTMPECQPVWDNWMKCWWWPCGYREENNPVIHGDHDGTFAEAVRDTHREHHRHQKTRTEWGIAVDNDTRRVMCTCMVEGADL